MYDIFPCFSYTNYMTLFQALGFQFKVAEKEICKLNRLNKIVMSISELNIHLRKIFCLIVVSKNHSLDCLLKPLMYALRRLIWALQEREKEEKEMKTIRSTSKHPPSGCWAGSKQTLIETVQIFSQNHHNSVPFEKFGGLRLGVPSFLFPMAPSPCSLAWFLFESSSWWLLLFLFWQGGAASVYINET